MRSTTKVALKRIRVQLDLLLISSQIESIPSRTTLRFEIDHF